MQTDHSKTPAPHNIWISYAHWLAIIAMTLEHMFRFIWPESALTPWAQAMGRIAFPLFAAIIAWHLVHNSQKPALYGLRVLVIGAVSQIPYATVISAEKLNICFTLGFSMLALIAVERIKTQSLQVLAAAVALVLATAARPYIEYGLWGLLLVPAFAIAFRHRDRLISTVPALTMCALINSAPSSVVISVLTGCGIFYAAHFSPSQLPRPPLPRWLRLAWYPLHLGAIAGIMSL